LVSHRFVEDNVLSCLDSLGIDIIIKDVFEGLGETEENTSPSVRGVEFIGTTGTSREGEHTTTKHAKKTKIGFVARANLDRRRGSITMGSHIVKLQEVVKA
jgi:hypothetical protein